jgi:serpin B
MRIMTWTAAALAAGLSPSFAAPNEASLNTFAVNLYQHLAIKGENLFFSPYSASCALGMTWEAARGRTADEIAAGLGMPGDKLRETFSTLNSRLNGMSGSNQLTVANGLWIDQAFPIRHEFVQMLRQDFSAAVFTPDFRHQREAARQQINDWAADKTQDRIQNLIPPGAIDPSTRAVLGNAIYFKGVWDMPFKKAATREQPFTTNDGKKIQVPMMERRLHACGFFEQPDFQALELAYAGEELSMVVLLPRDPAGLPALEKQLTPEHLDGWLTALRPEEVDVYLPRFKLETGFQLNQALEAMGIRLAFTDAADLSGMEDPGDGKLKISAMFQKAFVEVNEEGTEAAAATGVIAAPTAVVRRAPPPIFRADHPFLFLIRERKTNTILFMGRLARDAS